jgi:amphi-Trp domain-containing protein
MAETTAEAAAPAPAEPPAGKRAARKPKAKQRIAFASAMQRDEAVAYFEAILAGLRKGALRFQLGGESVALAPPPYLEVGVAARRKGGRHKVVFRLSWRTRDGEELTVT